MTIPMTGTVRRAVDRLGDDALAFALLRGLTMVGGMAALFLVPLSPAHRLHRVFLLAGFVAYKVLLFVVLVRWASRAREIFLATLAADLALVFLVVWFTGGGESPFFLLFYLLVALNAYYFGSGIGALAATLASALLAVANALVAAPAPWVHIGSRAILLGLLGVALGHVSSRERQARARAEALNREMESAIAKLARAEQLAAVGRLSAKMAHEVRSPLGAINLNVDVLSDIVRECPGAAMGEAQDLLREIRSEVRALAELTDEYLAAARSRRASLEKDSLNDMLTELVAFLEPLAAHQRIHLALDLETTLPPIAFDRARLKQAVRNLVKNAIELLPEGGHVTVGTSCDDEWAMITVTDDGPGVTATAAAHLFEPFFTTKIRGTGLGLSIAEQIGREHGGDVTWSNRPGGGAAFRIRLPVERRA